MSDEIFEKFRSATEADCVKIVKSFLKQEGDVNAKGKDGKTLLHLAAEKGDVEVIKFLLVKGAHVNIEDKDGKAPLDLATSEETRALLKVNIDLLEAAEKGDVKEVERLVDKGANINIKDKDGNIPLLKAAVGNKWDIVKSLVRKKADINVENNCDITLLYLAIKSKDIDMTKFLLDRDAIVNNRTTPLHIAAKFGNEKLVNLFLDKEKPNIDTKDSAGRTPIHLAIESQNEETVKYLVSEGADVSAKDGNISLLLAVKSGNEKVLELLLEKVQLSEEDVTNVLPFAIERGYTEIVKTLVSKGADVNAEDKDGETALMKGARMGHTKIVKILICRGAGVNAKDEGGKTALMRAAGAGHAKIVEALVYSGAMVNEGDCRGWTALQLAIKSEDEETVRLLLKGGADVNRYYESKRDRNDDRFRTPRMSVPPKPGSSPLPPLLLAIEVKNEKAMKLLLGGNADVSITDKDGKNPLHYAIKSKNREAIRLLLRKNANICQKDGDNDAPLKLALNDEDRELAKLFVKYALLSEQTGETKDYLLWIIKKEEEEFSEYCNKCLSEIKEMQEEKICGSTTFYNILLSKGDKLVSHVRDKNIAKKLEEGVHKEKFPMYADEIESQYRAGKERKNLLDKGAKLLTSFELRKSDNSRTLLLEICEKIIGYLEDIDIERFIRKSDMARTLGLLDLFVRKIKGQECAPVVNQPIKEGSTLNIMKEFKKILKNAAKKSKVSLGTYKDIEELVVQEKDSEIPSVLYSVAKKACDGDKGFLNVFNEVLEEEVQDQKMLSALEDKDIGIFVNLFCESLKKDSAVTRSQTKALRSLLKEVRKLGKKGDEIILKIKGNDRIPQKCKEQVSQIYDELCNSNVSEDNGVQEQQPVSHLSDISANQAVTNLQSRKKG